MIKGVIFDMDGVLADSEPYYFARRMEFLQRKSVASASMDPADFSGSNDAEIWKVTVPHDEALRDALRAEFLEYRKTRPIPYGELANPQAQLVFAALKEKGLKLAIASSSPRVNILELAAAAGIADLADYIISGAECARHKPDPEIYHKALAGLDLRPEEAVAVEDSPRGIAAAKAAGLYTFALVQIHAQLDQSAADQRVEQLTDLIGEIDPRNKMRA